NNSHLVFMVRILGTPLIAGTQWMNLWLRMMGAHVGKNVYCGLASYMEHTMLSIGDESVLDYRAYLLGHERTTELRIGNSCPILSMTKLQLLSSLEKDVLWNHLHSAWLGVLLVTDPCWLPSVIACLAPLFLLMNIGKGVPQRNSSR